MRVGIVCCWIVVLMAAMWIKDTEGLWCTYCRFFWGRSKNRSLGLTCPFSCRLLCRGNKCTAVCAKSCLLKTKDGVNIKPFPSEFQTYDQNQDGFITLKELAETLLTDEESTAAVMKLTDVNGDRKLSKDEFNAAPFHKMKENQGL